MTTKKSNRLQRRAVTIGIDLKLDSLVGALPIAKQQRGYLQGGHECESQIIMDSLHRAGKEGHRLLFGIIRTLNRGISIRSSVTSSMKSSRSPTACRFQDGKSLGNPTSRPLTPKIII